MVRKKKQTVYELHNQLYWQRHGWSPSIKEQYPAVALIKVRIDFKDFDGHGDPAPVESTLDPNQKAFFHRQCPYRECVRGGFDFSDIVRQALAHPGKEATGSVTCPGWQDEERINKNQCMLEASFKVTVERLTEV